MPLRVLDEVLGEAVGLETLALPKAVAVARIVCAGDLQGYRFIDARRVQDGAETVIVDVHVDRPQRFVHPLKPIERIALQFGFDQQPRVLALREGFPDTPHQNPGHRDDPILLCVHDRPWVEGRLSWTPMDFLVRVQNWLGKTARGELHGAARAPDPVFVHLGPSIIIPRSVFQHAWRGGIELNVFRVTASRQEMLLTTRGEAPPGATAYPMIMIALMAEAQAMGRMRFPPRTFEELAAEVGPLGIDLQSEIGGRIAHFVRSAWEIARNAGRPMSRDPDILRARLGVIIFLPVQDEGLTTTGRYDVRGFLTVGSVIDLGVAMGCLERGPDGVHGHVLGGLAGHRIVDLELQTAQIHVDHDREIATLLSGRAEADSRPVTIVGAGAIGSHVSTMLAREGLYTWKIIDDDDFLPHNVLRHTLFPADVGTSKAIGLARQLGYLLADASAAVPIVANVLDAGDANAGAALEALATSETILDASASVAVSRHLSDLPGVEARRISFFFNPDGTDGVILAEPKARNTTLRDIEAQYYAMIAKEPDLAGHLLTAEKRILYSGACRQVTNRMSESRVAALSALIAGELPGIITDDLGTVCIWRKKSEGIRLFRAEDQSWHGADLRGWRVMVSAELAEDLGRRRTETLPAETGGVLLGVVDTEAKLIHVCLTLSPPMDSVGDPGGFERGVSGLREQIADLTSETAGQLVYVGEWHSHSVRSPALPSLKDLVQLADLAAILDLNGVPGVMLIAGDEGLRFIATDFTNGVTIELGPAIP